MVLNNLTKRTLEEYFMKLHYNIAFAIFLALFAWNCGGNVYTAEECESTLNKLFDKISEKASEEDKAKFAPMRSTLMAKLKKDCMAGKYDLACIENAENIAAMQTCLK